MGTFVEMEHCPRYEEEEEEEEEEDLFICNESIEGPRFAEVLYTMSFM